MTHKIDIRFSRLFPWHFLFLAGIVLIIGMGLIVQKPILSILLVTGSVFVLSGYSGTEIDKAAKTYKEYNSFFFFIKNGKKIQYTAIEKLFITRSKVTQRMYSRTNHAGVFSNIEFNGYIKFQDGTKIQLLNTRKKEKLVSALKKISNFLNVTIEDHAPSEP